MPDNISDTTPHIGGSQPDLSKMDVHEPQHISFLRKRKQPEHEHECSIKEDLAAFRKEMMSILTSSSNIHNENLQSMRRDIVADIKVEINSVKELAEKMSKEQDRMKSELTELNNRILSVEEQGTSFSAAADSVNKVKETIEGLVAENNSLKQFALLNNIEISGVPLTKGENLNTIFRNICSKVGYTLLDTDVDTIHRVRRFQALHSNSQTNIRPPAIIVKFTQRRRKDELLAAVRARRGLTTADIELSGPASTLYLSDHLTPSNKLLLKLARQFKTEHDYQYLWTRDCKIFLRKNEKCKVIHIVSESVLKNLT